MTAQTGRALASAGRRDHAAARQAPPARQRSPLPQTLSPFYASTLSSAVWATLPDAG